jgi:hypothetical protein
MAKEPTSMRARETEASRCSSQDLYDSEHEERCSGSSICLYRVFFFFTYEFSL